MNIKNLIQDCNKELGLNYTQFKIREEDYNSKQEYETLRKTTLSEYIFMDHYKENSKLYETVEVYYKKLLARCPLSCAYSKKSSKFIRHFVKLDLARDNLNRAMRLKVMKHPLSNPSLLRGISYVRHFFLKRILICSINNEENNLSKLHQQNYFIPSSSVKTILKVMFEKSKPKINSPSEECKIESPSNSRAEVEYAIKPCVSRTQLAIECKAKVRTAKDVFESAFVQVDHAWFGELQISSRDIVFVTKPYKEDKPKYRLGPPKDMYTLFEKKIKKTWSFGEISRIFARRYNMIPQAFEMELKNKKTVFLVFFSEQEFGRLMKILHTLEKKNKLPMVEFVDDPLKQFVQKKYTEDWRKYKISNFEYLMRLNDYSSRSFQSMAQYPVFPWILQDYKNTELNLKTAEYRDLHLPIAGLTKKRQAEAKKKYENTDDFPGGRFQYGTHYMPGRGVLGYLMRLQPYTLMIYRFDSGGDCPSRQFHFIETMWNNILTQCDSNLELIPEFFFNPEMFENQYFLY